MSHALAQHLRRNMTDAERRLWRALSRCELAGYKFRRQHPIGPYVVDFVCLERRLIIEVDGVQHGDDARQAADLRRTEALAKEGFEVFRVWNAEAMGNLDGVAQSIFAALEARPIVPRSRRAPRLRVPPPPARPRA
jgi:very-short-patch-repair endonuclease